MRGSDGWWTCDAPALCANFWTTASTSTTSRCRTGLPNGVGDGVNGPEAAGTAPLGKSGAASVAAAPACRTGLVTASMRDRLRRESLTTPDLVDLEVVSVLRRLHRAGGLDARRGTLAVQDLHDLPFDRVPHRAL